jgi:hypothetical protein
MDTERDTKDLEALVEAQARGETIEGVPTEAPSLLDAELDTRTSKGDPNADGGTSETGVIWGS